MATHANSIFAPAVLLSEDELLALFDRGAGIDKLVDRLIDIMDAADAPLEDLEDGDPAEHGGDDEESLGWPAGMSQRKLGENTADGDSTSPETHGKGFRRCGPDDFEPEAGYDLPEGDDERCDSDNVDLEPSLGAPNNHHNQTDWNQGHGSDCERVDEDGDDLDRAEGPDDNGIADQDGANEQWQLHMGVAVV